MTQARRIILNIIATYGRSLFALVCGVFTARWVLSALGAVDYGLYGVVGGLTGFVVFISYILQGATSRFYAFCLGEAKGEINPQKVIVKCQKWFNTSLCIHFFFPIVLLGVGYYIGIWAVENFLTIPIDKVQECIWVFRFSCLSCFVSMASVPFYGMYISKQYIAELSIYGFCTTLVNVGLAYYMVTHEGDWLVVYSGVLCFAAVSSQVVIVIRAMCIFPECRIRLKYWWNLRRFKLMFDYAGWNFIGAVGRMLQMQGSAVLINKYFGPSVNAGFSLANTINNHCQSLVSSLRTAFIPAVTTLCGACDYAGMRKMAFRACKFSSILALIFVIPISLELNNILVLWLKNPPPYTEGLCWCIMVTHVIENTSMGQTLGICAFGRVAKYQCVSGGIRVLILPVAWIFIVFGGNVYYVGFAFIIIMTLYTLSTVWLARSLAGMSGLAWLRDIIIPIFIVTLATCALGAVVVVVLPASFYRILVTGTVSELVFMLLVWKYIFDSSEREVILSKIRAIKWRRK